MDRDQQDAFKEAVERKKDETEARSRAHRPIGGPPADGGGVPEEIQSDLIEKATNQETLDVRDKKRGKGQKAADKWKRWADRVGRTGPARGRVGTKGARWPTE